MSSFSSNRNDDSDAVTLHLENNISQLGAETDIANVHDNNDDVISDVIGNVDNRKVINSCEPDQGFENCVSRIEVNYSQIREDCQGILDDQITSEISRERNSQDLSEGESPAINASLRPQSDGYQSISVGVQSQIDYTDDQPNLLQNSAQENCHTIATGDIQPISVDFNLKPSHIIDYEQTSACDDECTTPDDRLVDKSCADDANDNKSINIDAIEGLCTDHKDNKQEPDTNHNPDDVIGVDSPSMYVVSNSPSNVDADVTTNVSANQVDMTAKHHQNEDHLCYNKSEIFDLDTGRDSKCAAPETDVPDTRQTVPPGDSSDQSGKCLSLS